MVSLSLSLSTDSANYKTLNESCTGEKKEFPAYGKNWKIPSIVPVGRLVRMTKTGVSVLTYILFSSYEISFEGSDFAEIFTAHAAVFAIRR